MEPWEIAGSESTLGNLHDLIQLVKYIFAYSESKTKDVKLLKKVSYTVKFRGFFWGKPPKESLGIRSLVKGFICELFGFVVALRW